MSKFGPRGTMVAACLSFVCHGAISASIGPALPGLAAHTGSSLAAVGALLTALYVGAILSLLVAGPTFDRFGQYPVFMAGAALMGLGALGLTAATSLPAALACAFVVGLGHGAIDISCNLVVAEVFAHRRAAAVSLVNVFFGVGAVLGPLAASATLKLWNTAFPALWLGAGLMLLQLLIIPRMARVPASDRHGKSAASQAPVLRAILRSPIFWSLGALTLIYVGLESGMSSWTTTYLAATTASSTAAGALASAGFWLALAGGRVAATAAGTRYTARAILFASLLGAGVGGLLLSASSGNGPATVLGVLLTGFSYGPIFPVIFSINNGTFRGLSGTAGSLLIACGSLGSALLPWLQGILLVNAGPLAGILLIAAGAALMLILFAAYNALSRQNQLAPSAA
jgi:FHS family glucose/mannose:H+ symporter-like MFS transporter